jgi:uncharacterized membrane protein YfcA
LRKAAIYGKGNYRFVFAGLVLKDIWLSWGLAIYAIACVFTAAIVRGYSGFGFSLLAITSLSLLLPPTEVIPPVFMMEVAASLSLLPGIWKDSLALAPSVGRRMSRWYSHRRLVSCKRTCRADEDHAGVCRTCFGRLFWFGYTTSKMPSAVETIATGGISGLLNGALGIGGPPIVIFFFNSPAGVAIGRASLIAFFIATDTMAAFSSPCQRCWQANGSARAASRQRIRQISAAGYWSSWSHSRY